MFPRTRVTFALAVTIVVLALFGYSNYRGHSGGGSPASRQPAATDASGQDLVGLGGSDVGANGAATTLVLAATSSTLRPPFTYTIQPGETLADIARRAKVALADLADANSILDTARVRAGQKIIIPSPTIPGVPTSRSGTTTTVPVATTFPDDPTTLPAAPAPATAPVPASAAPTTRHKSP
jgi:LysM repeat protein